MIDEGGGKVGLTEKAVSLLMDEGEEKTEILGRKVLVILDGKISLKTEKSVGAPEVIPGIESTPILRSDALSVTALYNLEPFTGPETPLDIDLGLYQMEPELD